MWSWILTAVGLFGIIITGRKIWWSWHFSIGQQGLWILYALLTKQYGFIAGSLVYTAVFAHNALRWTREHKAGNSDKVTLH